MNPTPTDDTKSILLADDDSPVREILRLLLQGEGYAVTTVSDGHQAWKELHEHPFDVVITDLKMPHMSGLELLARIDNAGLNVATIVMSAFTSAETVLDVMRKGAFDFLRKPFKNEELFSIIKRAFGQLSIRKTAKELREAAAFYRISEAVARDLSLDNLLDIILDSVVHDLRADIATLTMRDPSTGVCFDRISKFSPNADGDRTWNGSVEKTGLLNLSTISHSLVGSGSLLIHGDQAVKYFKQVPKRYKFLSMCSTQIRSARGLMGVLTAYSYTRGRFNEGQRRLLTVFAKRAALSIDHANTNVQLNKTSSDLNRLREDMYLTYRNTVASLSHALEECDPYTHGHSQRVGNYAQMLGCALTLKGSELDKLHWAALLHDIGKIGIRQDKLNKPGKLTAEETAMLRTHPAKGKRILEPIPFMSELIPGALCHHESWDGSGYPNALSGENIPIYGRIVAIADCYDAMTSDRAYRKGVDHEAAMAELERCAGEQFDARLVETFSAATREMRAGSHQDKIESPWPNFNTRPNRIKAPIHTHLKMKRR